MHARSHIALPTPNLGGMTVDELLAFHHAVFGDARMEGEGGGTSGGSGDAGQGGTGNNGGDSGQGAGAAGTGQNGGQTGGAGQQTGGQGNGQTGQQAEAQEVASLPQWAQKLIADTRNEAAGHRTKANEAATAQQTMLDNIAKALGLKGDDEKDPAKLAQQLTDTQAQARESAVKLAVYQTAAKHQGDPNALLDSNSFLAKVKDLDPTAGDFAGKVDEAIKSAVADNPKLKAGQAPGASGAEFTGGSGEGGARPKSIKEALARG